MMPRRRCGNCAHRYWKDGGLYCSNKNYAGGDKLVSEYFRCAFYRKEHTMPKGQKLTTEAKPIRQTGGEVNGVARKA